jgi:pimeloyl-ACP methyl ester carboxylesterase
MLALAWIGLALLALLVAGASSNAVRPIAVVWDVVCYLPRTGHPFGPPAYAERAVPEIAGRLFEWLDAGGETDPDRIRLIEHRRAVLVGHSMGAVLGVSALALLASSPQTRPVLGRISLLTIGVQLRSFFGRMFPELHGPDVLGTEPARAPRAFAADSDPCSVDFDQTGLVDRARGTLSGTLLAGYGVPWRSLWRLTDILGFVAEGPRPNSVDVLADELDLTGYMVAVDGHRVYYRAPQFQAELLALAGLPPE